MLSIQFIYFAECRYAECHDAECRYAECRYAKYRVDLGGMSIS